MNLLVQKLENTEKFKDYIKSIKNENSPVQISGLSDVGKVQFAYCTKDASKRPVCIITYNEMQAKNLIRDLSYFTSNLEYFPKREIASYDFLAESKDLPYERIEVLNKIRENKVDIVITTIEAIMQKMIRKEDLYKSEMKLKVGVTYSLEKVKENLLNLGYERQDLVETRGQFSIRGGIVDIGINDKNGIRIEFWGDDIDSIRSFQLSSQRSTQMLNEITINPAHEFLLIESIEKITKKICNNSNNLNLGDNKLSESTKLNFDDKFKKQYLDKIRDNLNEDLELIKNGDYISKADKYFNCFYEKQNTFLDYLGKDYLIIIDEKSKINQRVENIIKENNQLIKNLVEKSRLVPEEIQNISNFKLQIDEKQIIYFEKQDIVKELGKNRNNEYIFRYRDINFFKSEIELLIDELKQMVEQKKTVIILGGNETNVKKICSLLTQKNINHKYVEKLEDSQIENKEVLVTMGALSSGFECFDSKLVVISSEEFFSSNAKKRKVSSAFKQGEKVVFADLKIGDFVVHRVHGIGQFIGVNTIKADGIIKDYLKLRYKNDDILYVPTNSLDSVRKYIGAGDASPKINKLGGKEWESTKKKVKSNLREVARELIELYAKRQKAAGYAFSKDTQWQRQFEEDFPYKETDDQLRCIEETKKDMEMPKPMDRLLCGDVGYGKTEVAIRAAFKSVMDQKQVAYLVPTTVLANQQYEEFKTRMEKFAIRVELLNRFRTKKQQDEVIKKLKLGEVDVVIGTHRILSKDVEFKDLGLLIIDEEHRFGVKDKEKIKQLKNNVDVLTMTATPIPRTLHMSIVGVRDMSVIYEPPHNRKPVQTYVLEFDEEVIKEAITKELERDGQVFYLFNNVEGIEKRAHFLSELVPEAEVGFAHGKMTGRQLEDIMMQFIKKEINVLVCTTILESGIDIPNANTIIVENADRLGLAQLYQIRGRVGRSNKQAYAYITYKRDKLLTEVADKRLKAMREFTEFGSGFKIAMRDLEIRGAGSLLRRNTTWAYGTSWI